jgi:hypothetical protein
MLAEGCDPDLRYGARGQKLGNRRSSIRSMRPNSRRKLGAAAETALFCSGVFAGGAIDHAILAFKRKQHTPYGVRVSASGNWVFAVFDAVVALAGYALYRRLS